MFAPLALLLAAAPQMQVSLVRANASSNAGAVTKELKAQLPALEGCYDLALKEAPALHGTVTLTFTVQPDLGVATISASEDSVKDDTLVSCVLARLRFGEWPNPKKPMSVTATFRFELKAR